MDIDTPFAKEIESCMWTLGVGKCDCKTTESIK